MLKEIKEYLSYNIDEEAITDYKKIIIFLVIIYSLIDIVALLLFIFYKSFRSKKIKDLKNYLIILLIINIIINIIYLKIMIIFNIFIEIILVSLNAFEFYLILSFLTRALPPQKKFKLNEKRSHKIMSIHFALIIFSYDKIPLFDIFSKLGLTSKLIILTDKAINIFISIIRDIFVILFFRKYDKIVRNKIDKIVKHIIGTKKKKKNSYLMIYIRISPTLCVFFFIAYYVFDIGHKFLEKNLFALYYEIFLYHMKQLAKTYIVIICGLIIYLLNKMKRRSTNNVDERRSIIINEN